MELVTRSLLSLKATCEEVCCKISTNARMWQLTGQSILKIKLKESFNLDEQFMINFLIFSFVKFGGVRGWGYTQLFSGFHMEHQPSVNFFKLHFPFYFIMTVFLKSRCEQQLITEGITIEGLKQLM